MPMGVAMHSRRRAFLAALVAALAACAGSGHGARSVEVRETGQANTALDTPANVRLRIGDGPLSKPMANPVLGKAALVLRFPADWQGQMAKVVVERVRSGQREPWLALDVRVRPDATMPLLGLEPGAYLVTATPKNGRPLTGGAEVGAQESGSVLLRSDAAAPTR